MTVSSTSSQTVTPGSVSTPDSSSVAGLEKQLASVQQQIDKENQSKDDDKTKQKVVQALEMELQMIQIEIQQAQAKSAKKVSGNDATQAGGNSSNQNTTVPKTRSTQLLDVTA